MQALNDFSWDVSLPHRCGVPSVLFCQHDLSWHGQQFPRGAPHIFIDVLQLRDFEEESHGGTVETSMNKHCGRVTEQDFIGIDSDFAQSC